VTRRRAERALAYALLVVVAIIGFAPFVIIVLLSTKARIDILQVPPTLDFDMEQIVANYSDVLFRRGFVGYTVNSIVVTFLTVIVALGIGTPAAYGFSRMRFRGRDTWASTILSFRFMPPVAVAIPILLMMRFLDLDNTLPGLVIPYVAFSLPAVVAGFGVVQIGLRSTATIYGATLIVMAALALVLSGRLEEGEALQDDELADAVAG